MEGCCNFGPVELTEDDIPGAKLPSPDPTDASIEQLKRWLSCRRGVSTSGTKAELVKRVKDFIEQGLDKYMMDPDNGVNVRRKLRNVGTTDINAKQSNVTKYSNDSTCAANATEEPLSEKQRDLGNMLKEQLGCEYVTSLDFTDSGFINSAYAFDTDKYGKVFVKVNSRSGAKPMFDGENAGLRAIMATETARVPKPYKLVDYKGGAVLVMEYMDMDRVGQYASTLGESIARMHLHNKHLKIKEEKEANRVGCGESRSVDKFGFDVPTCCGYVPTGNDWYEDWMTFFARQKLQHQIDAIEKTYGDRDVIELWSHLQRKLPEFFKNLGAVTPALLHGDLTKINVSGDSEGPVAFDPAAFYGHSEYDLASVDMFGGFDPTFFTAYHNIIPKAAGFDHRARLYQLFNQFNIWNHFGSAYKGQVLGAMKDLLQ